MLKRESCVVNSDRDYQKISSKYLAGENNIEYVENIEGRILNVKGEGINKILALEGKYIFLYPPNDGTPTCPFEWYSKIDGKIQKVLDNHSSFKEIINLKEIILKMIRLYEKYIDEDMFISSFDFAIRLNDKICADYFGEADLVITGNSICNSKVKPEQIIEAKKYFINKFLDHYLGLNFGSLIENNLDLEKELHEFNRLVINKGLRKYAGFSVEVWTTKDVKQYELEKK